MKYLILLIALTSCSGNSKETVILQAKLEQANNDILYYRTQYLKANTEVACFDLFNIGDIDSIRKYYNVNSNKHKESLKILLESKKIAIFLYGKQSNELVGINVLLSLIYTRPKSS